MELADISQPRLLAQAVHRQIPKEFPVNVEGIALGAGIRSIERHSESAFEGALVTDEYKNEGFILVKETSPRERQRFTIGHELGHLFNQWHQPTAGEFRCSSADMLANEVGKERNRLRMETEANLFATELLMPLAEVSMRVGKSGVNLDDALRFSKIFGVSKIAAARRLTDVDQNAALVVSHLDRVKYSIWGKEFPRISPASGQPLPAGTISMTSKQELSDQDEVDCSIWLSARQDPETILYEQVLLQDQGYKLTLLVLARSECDDDDAEREARDRSAYRPGFR